MCSKKEICILIPIYKESLNEYESQSVTQCIKILSDYTIHFICSNELDITLYEATFPEIINYSFFDQNYFKDVSGYNSLLLSYNFYKKFKNYDFMLVHQTDCFVFKDDLLAWAHKDYDYIGGLWFEGFHGNPELGEKLWYPGNGGLSLRKIKPMIDLLTSKSPLRNWRQLLIEKKIINKGYIFKDFKGAVVLFLNLFGYKNNSSYLAKQWEKNEDVFFLNMNEVYNRLKVPNVNKALFFAWDRRPDYLFKNYKQLPFACHAWYRTDFPYTENKDFWSNFIELK
jgi:hypothetical protein